MEDEVLKVRERLHKLADTVQAHETRMAEYAIKITYLEQQIVRLTTQTATREQLDAAVLALGEKVSGEVKLMTEKIMAIAADTSRIIKGIYWVVGIVLTSVLLAGMALILRGPR